MRLGLQAGLAPPALGSTQNPGGLAPEAVAWVEVGILAEAVLVLHSCPVKSQQALAVVENDSLLPREGKSSLYMRRKKKSFPA